MRDRNLTGLPDPRWRTQVRTDVTVLAVVLVAYLLVRIAWAPTGGFARDHLTDLLAGAALPSLLSLVFQGRETWASWSLSLRGKLAMVVGATFVWEGLVPFLSERSTADPVDALCYLGGALGQHGASVLVRLAGRRRHDRSPFLREAEVATAPAVAPSTPTP